MFMYSYYYVCSVLYILFSLCCSVYLCVNVTSATANGDRGSTVVKVLCYKSEGRWFDPIWCQWIFH